MYLRRYDTLSLLFKFSNKVEAAIRVVRCIVDDKKSMVLKKDLGGLGFSGLKGDEQRGEARRQRSARSPATGKF